MKELYVLGNVFTPAQHLMYLNSKLEIWNLRESSFAYFPFNEERGTSVYNNDNFYYDSLVWGNPTVKLSTLPAGAVWWYDPGAPILCEANERLVNGHCVEQTRSLWFSRASTYRIDLPLSALGKEFTWEMWVFLTMPAGIQTEVVLSRSGGTEIDLVTDLTNADFRFYGAGLSGSNVDNVPYFTASQTKASISGKWVFVSCGNSQMLNKAYIYTSYTTSLPTVSQGSGFGSMSTASSILSISSDDPIYAIDGAIKEIRIFNEFRGYATGLNEINNELNPASEPKLVNYWKLSESTGTQINDFSTTASSASLSRTVTGKTAPNWVIVSPALSLYRPQKPSSDVSKPH